MILSPRSFALGMMFVIAACSQAAEIPKPPDWSKVKNEVARMRNGTPRVRNPDSQAETKKNQDAIKVVAQWLAYTIATAPYNGEPIQDKAPAFPERSMSALMTEAEYYCTIPIQTGNQGKLTIEQMEYGAEMGAAMADAVKVVLENSARPIERVNAVRLMALTARMPAPALAAVFVQTISNPKISDAEKLYAFQGLRNLMEQTDIVDANRHVIRGANAANELGQISEALAGYIVQDRGRPDDREKAVIEFVRRHAVAALAQFKDGVIRKPGGVLVSRPSWTLMRVIASDPTVSPPFTIQEKVEAAIGFCQQKVDPEMNLDVATFNLAGVGIPGVLVEFSSSANLDVLRKEKEGTLPASHWKILAARLSYALAIWRENCKTLPAARYPQYVVTFATTSLAILTPIEREGGGASTGKEVGALNTWTVDYRPKAWMEDPPKAAQLYKDDPKSLLPFYVAPPKAGDPKLTTPPIKTPDPKTVDPKVVAPKKGPLPPPK